MENTINKMAYTKIIQISDIHIRAGDSITSRYDEYTTQIDRLILALKEYDAEKTLIVLIGDIFHDKSRIGPSAQLLAQRLFRGLSQMRTIVVRGNHDYRQDQPDEPDLIKPFFDEEPENLEYLDETGLFQLGNIEVGLVAVQDTLIRGAGSGITTALPDFPVPEGTGEYQVALFHGSFGGALLQNGTEVEERNNYPLTWFSKSYDLLLFGDIHVQQICRATIQPGNDFASRTSKNLYVTGRYSFDRKKQPWAYSGSLIQQNFGESLWAHGFIEWNLETSTATSYHVRNDVGYVIVTTDSSDKPCIKVRHGRKSNILPIETIVTYGWFPTTISLRFSTSARTQSQHIQTLFEEAGIVIRDTGYVEENNVEDVSTAVVSAETKESIVNDLSSLNSVDTWINYFTNDANIPDGDWTQWVKHPELMKVPVDIFEKATADNIKARNAKFQKIVEGYIEKRDQKRSTKGFRIHYIEFSWLLCFGEDNWIDLDDFTKQVSLINGNNGSGKSSLLEIICLALYGDSFPSRQNKSYSACIINQHKPDRSSANTKICFSIDGQKYWITRSFEQQPNNPKTLWQRYVRLIEHAKAAVIKENANCVLAWVEQFVGKFSHFLLTTIISQMNDSDFFGMSAKEQKIIIDSLLQLDVCDDFRIILKEARLLHDHALDKLSAYQEANQRSTALIDETSSSDQDEERCLEIGSQVKEIQTLLSSTQDFYSNHPLKVFQTLQSDYLNEKKHIQREIDIPVEGEYAILKQSRQQLRDRLAVLRAKRLTKCKITEDPVNETFDNLEQKLQKLINQRGTEVQVYDKQKHTDWQTKNRDLIAKPPPADPTKPLPSLLKELELIQEELAAIEIDEVDFKPVSVKVLGGLKKQNDDLVIKLCDLDQEKKIREKELSQIKVSANNTALLAEYIDLRTRFTNSLKVETIEEAYKSYQQASHLISISAFTQKEHDIVKKQLEEIGLAEYNPDCKACIGNPFRVKKEQLQINLSQLLKEQKKQQSEIEQLLNNNSYDKLKVLHEKLSSYPVDKMTLYEQQLSKQAILKKELLGIDENISTLEEERDDLGYDTQVIVNEYYDLKATKQILTDEITNARFHQEQVAWTKSASLAILDEEIQVLERSTLLAYSKELNATEADLEKVERNIKTHDLISAGLKRLEELESILSAYPYWLKSKDLEVKLKPLSQQFSSLQASIQQSKMYNAQLQKARTLAEQMASFRQTLEHRLKLITEMGLAFDKFTDWVYPRKVGPAIEEAVNKVLNSIVLPRPIQLKAEWDSTQFNWYVQDGITLPPYEKASGAQRFFVSLALRLAFSRMGAANMINAQMFLDEGFTACDTETMERVPTLLRSLIKDQEHLQTIFIVSHLDTLKAVADRNISITRGANSSKLLLGERQQVPRIMETKADAKMKSIGDHVDAPAIPKKKAGRPKKVTVEKEIVVNE